MAQFKLEETLIIGDVAMWEWTTWIVARDKECETDIIDQTIEDPINLMEWNTPLIDSDGVMFNGDTILFGKVQTCCDGNISTFSFTVPCGVVDDTVTFFPYDLPITSEE